MALPIHRSGRLSSPRTIEALRRWTATYVVKALPPARLALSAPTAIIPNAYSATIKTTLVFRKP